MKRRTFIQASSMAAAAITLPVWARATDSNTGIGLQLYTLKDIIRKDIKGTLQKVAAIGYSRVEPYDYSDGKMFGMPYQDFARMNKDLGLEVVSCHYNSGFTDPQVKGTLRNDWQMAVDDAAAAGQQYMVLAWLEEGERKTIDDYKSVCDLINKSGEICKKAGIKIGYHNHWFEFQPVEGQTPYDVMLKELDPSLVTMEMDMYWVVFAGADPLHLMENHRGRFELWHIKDMDKAVHNRNADVGTGLIDFHKIFADHEISGMKYFFLEQEYFSGSPIDSIQVGYDYLKRLS